MKFILLLLIVVGPVSGVSSAAVTGVYANTVGTFANAWSPIGGQPGSQGWYWGDIRNAGTVGITTTYDRTAPATDLLYPNNLGGSLEFNLTQGSDKAGFNMALLAAQPLSTLDSASYDWYRNSSSTNNTAQAPAFFFYIDPDGLNLGSSPTFGLKYEPVYDGFLTAPTDVWTTSNIISSTNLWSWNSPNPVDNFVNYGLDLNDWKTSYPNGMIVGLGLDAGSGWVGQFSGAADFVTLDFTGTANDQTYDFTVIPEPTHALAGILCLAGMFIRRRNH
jgi:hypothetical protein